MTNPNQAPPFIAITGEPEFLQTGEPATGGGFYDDEDSATVVEFGDDGIDLTADALGNAFDTAVGLLGFLARTHGGLRAAMEHAGSSMSDGELPAYVETLLAQAEDETGAFRIATTVRRGSVTGVLDELWASCDDREQRILRDRIVAVPPATLDEIGQATGVTRERIRQLQKKLTTRLQSLVTAGPVADLLAGIRAHAHPVSTLEQITGVFPELAVVRPGWDAPLWQILDAFDDDFRIEDDWVCFPDLLTAEQRTGDLLAPLVNDEGVVELTTVRAALPGIVEIEGWLVHCGYLIFDGHVLTRTTPQPDLAAGVLSVVGHPMSAAELLAATGVETSERSFRGTLTRGKDLDRVGADSWGLKRWGMESYSTIADLIGHRVDAAVNRGADGADLGDLIKEISSSFGVSERSVRTYAATGDFTSRGGIVRRRDTPMVNTSTPELSNGLYRRDGRWCLLLTVTPDHLRGSGFTVPNGMTVDLGLEWNETRMLASDYGEHRVTWGNIGNSSVGSIRRHLEDLGTEVGDRVWIDLHGGERFTVTQAPASQATDLDGLDWLVDHVGAVPGEDAVASYAAVAEALGLAPDAPRRKVLARFRHRSDAEAVEVLENLWI